MTEDVTTTFIQDRLTIRFLSQPVQDAVRVWRFADPAPCYAVLLREDAAGLSANQDNAFVLTLVRSGTTVLAQPVPEDSHLTRDDAARSAHVKLKNTELSWSPVSADLYCEAISQEEITSALVQFTYYERELRRLELEIADSWIELDEDRPFASRVGPSDLKKGELVGQRMMRALEQRMRLARIGPHFAAPTVNNLEARKLWKGLRRNLQIERRLEAASDHLEVFEHVYEMASQRFGEFEASRQAHIVELIIIVLLALETILMLIADSSKFRFT